MGVSMRLEVRQAQSLALTPQLLQSIRLLQYDHADLRDFLRREAERNPLIRLREPRTRALPPAAAGERPAAPDHRPSLAAHAFAEIAEALPESGDRRIALGLLDDLDEAGYLRVDIGRAAGRLGVPSDRIASVLLRLREAAEPAGLFAADLADCLAIQLRRRGRFDPVARLVIERLDIVARGDVAALRRLTGEDEAGVHAIVAELRSLDPRPGQRFAEDEARIVVPDVVVEPLANGGWRVRLDGQAVPRLHLDETYARTVEAGCRNEEERAFVGECRTRADWLARSLDQRARSILKVASEIVRRQQGFMTDGPQALRPMTLASIARAVGLHESTVSRIVANKHMATPRGTIAFKLLLSGEIASATGGAAHSAAGVRERIRRLVAEERPGNVLSDEEIAERLRSEGMDLARRTVAKYREQLAIPSSAQRRRTLRFARIAS